MSNQASSNTFGLKFKTDPFDIRRSRDSAKLVYQQVQLHLNRFDSSLNWAIDFFAIIKKHPVKFSFHEYLKPDNRRYLNENFFSFIEEVHTVTTPFDTFLVLARYCPIKTDESNWFMRAQTISYIVHCMKPRHCFAFNSQMHRTLKIYEIDWTKQNLTNEKRFKAFLRLLGIMQHSDESSKESFYIDFTIKMSPAILRRKEVWSHYVKNPEDGKRFMKTFYLDDSDERFMNHLAVRYNESIAVL